MLPIFAGFNLLKFFGGFNIFNGEKLGKLLFNLVIGVVIFILCMSLYKKLTGPTSNVERQVIEKYYACPDDSSLLRIRLWKIVNIGFGG